MTMDNGLDIPKDYIDNSYIILKLEELFNLTNDVKIKKKISAIIKEIRRGLWERKILYHLILAREETC